MKTTHRIKIGLVALSIAFAFTATPARAQIYVSAGNSTTDTVGKYNPDGSPVNASLVNLGSAIPGKMTLSGASLFVGNGGNIGKFNAGTGAGSASFITTTNGASGLAAFGTNLLAGVTTGSSTVVAEYDATTGILLNGSFITPSGFAFSIGLLVSGVNLFVSRGNTIGEYNVVTGAAVNASFITTTDPVTFGSLAVFGGHLFVLDGGNGVREYDATTGSLVNGLFITGLLQPPSDIAISGGNLLVATGNGTSSAFVSEYDATSGALVNQTFITPSQAARGLAVAPLPEPTTLVLAAIGALALLGRASRRRGQTTVKTTHRVSIGLVALSIAFPFTAKSDNAQFTAGYGNFSVNHSSGFGTTGSNSINDLYVQSPGYSSLFTYNQVLSEPGGPGISSGHAGLGLAMFSDLAAVVMYNGTGVSQSDVAGSSPAPAQLTIQYSFQPNLQSATPWNGIVSMHYVLDATVGPSIGDYDRFDAVANFSDGLGGPTVHLELHRLFDVPGSSFSGVDLYAEAPFSIAPSAIEIIVMTGTTTFTVLDPGGGGSITGQTIVPEVSTYTMLVIGIGLMAGATRFRRGSTAKVP